MSVECQECLKMFRAAFDNVLGMSRVIWECVGISEGVLGMLESERGTQRAVWQSFSLLFSLILRSHR